MSYIACKDLKVLVTIKSLLFKEVFYWLKDFKLYSSELLFFD